MAKKSNDNLLTWSGSLHKSFRLLPTAGFGNEDLMAFLNSEEGDDKDQVLARMEYDRSRAVGASDPVEDDDADADDGPDPKRYRDMKQVLEASGLLWQDSDGLIHFTEFGLTLKRFMPRASEKNVGLIAPHAALGLAVCQLRNPTGAGVRYHPDMRVFPFRFIWKAMLQAEGRISSDELNRAIFSTRNEEMLDEGISRILTYRRTGNLDDLGPETVTGKAKNDRLIPIVSLASFGWTLLNQKTGGFYTIKPSCLRYLQVATTVPVRHRNFETVEMYVNRVSDAACLPKDCR